MIAHLCRLAWNRRRSNLLLVGELFLSFIVLTPLIAGWVLFAAEELEPLGFEYEDVWSVRLSDRNYGERAQGDHQRNIELVWRELQALDQVEAVALASEAPFRFPSSWYGITSVRISDVGLDVLGLQLLSGRWFQSGDEALNWTPAVIDRELSQALFGDEDPVGKAIGDLPAMDRQGGNYFPRLDRVRVVGVVENCFYYGDYEKADLPGFIFLRISQEWVASPLQSWVNFLVKTVPGAGLAVGETLRSRIQAVVPADESIRFAVESLAARQEDDRLNQVQNLGFIAVISGLMMFMVALGLTGMMWQNVRRTHPGNRHPASGRSAHWPDLRTVLGRIGSASDGGHCAGLCADGPVRAVGYGVGEPGAGLCSCLRLRGDGARALSAGAAVRSLSELAGRQGAAGRGSSPRLIPSIGRRPC